MLILFLSFRIYLVNLWHSSISLLVIFFILSGAFFASHLILKQLVSCGESRPGSPNPPFHLGLGSLGLSVMKKALSQSTERIRQRLPLIWLHQKDSHIWTKTFNKEAYWKKKDYKAMSMSVRSKVGLRRRGGITRVYLGGGEGSV